LIFLHLNIIFNPSNSSNHSQTVTNFVLNPLFFTFNPLKGNNTNFTRKCTWIHYLSPSNQPWRKEDRRKMEIPLILDNLCYAMVGGW